MVVRIHPCVFLRAGGRVVKATVSIDPAGLDAGGNDSSRKAIMAETGPLKKSRIYFLVPIGVREAAISAMNELEVRGFRIHSTWHYPARVQLPLLAEILRLQQADIVITWPSGLLPEQWLMLGAAHAAGTRVIALGSLMGLSESTKEFFMIRFEGGFSELLANDLAKLGGEASIFYKKPKIVATEGDRHSESTKARKAKIKRRKKNG